MESLMWKKIRIRNIWEVLWILFVVVFIQMVSYIVFTLIFYGGVFNINVLNDSIKNDRFPIYVSIIYSIATLIYGVRKYHKKTEFDTDKTVYTTIPLKKIWILVLIGFGSCMFFTFFLNVISHFFPKFFLKYNDMMNSMISLKNPLSYLYIIILGPLSEEYIFRGNIFKRMDFSFGLFFGNIIQAFLFGVFHGNIIQGLYTFFLGLILGLSVYIFKNLYASIIIHVIFNAVTIGLSLLYAAPGFKYKSVSIQMIFISGIIMFFIGLFFLIKEFKIVRKNEKNID